MMENIILVFGSLIITLLGIVGIRWLLCCSSPAIKAMKAQDERDRISRGMSGL